MSGATDRRGGLVPPLGAEHDTQPVADAASGTRRTYVVCATPRTGSGLLCRALAAPGIAGVPMEYFKLDNRAVLAGRWGCGPELTAYVETLLARRSHGGVFGTKLHWSHLEQVRSEMAGTGGAEADFGLSAALIEGLLPRPRYIHVYRMDVNRQAISLFRAARTGRWSDPAGFSGPRPEIRYSFAAIDLLRDRIANEELHWHRFFRSNGIVPIEVAYEELATAYEATVARVLGALVPEARPPTIAEPASGRQSDAHSERLLERYRRDLDASRYERRSVGALRRVWRGVRDLR